MATGGWNHRAGRHHQRRTAPPSSDRQRRISQPQPLLVAGHGGQPTHPRVLTPRLLAQSQFTPVGEGATVDRQPWPHRVDLLTQFCGPAWAGVCWTRQLRRLHRLRAGLPPGGLDGSGRRGRFGPELRPPPRQRWWPPAKASRRARWRLRGAVPAAFTVLAALCFTETFKRRLPAAMALGVSGRPGSRDTPPPSRPPLPSMGWSVRGRRRRRL